jgi:hypothetical protein
MLSQFVEASSSENLEYVSTWFMDRGELLVQLKASLQGAIPIGYVVEIVDWGILVRAMEDVGGVGLSIDPILEYANNDPERLAEALKVQIEGVQEYIAESTTWAWPGTTVFPKLLVEHENGWICISFVSDDGSTLELEPLDISQ